MRNNTLIFLLLALVWVTACKKDKQPDSVKENPPEFSLELNSSKPWFPVEIDVIGDFHDLFLELRMGDSSFKAYPNEQKKLVFICPNLNKGDYTLSSEYFSFDFKVEEGVAVTNPDLIIDEYVSNLNSAASTRVSEEYGLAIQDFRDELNALLQEASPHERLQFASFIAAHGFNSSASFQDINFKYPDSLMLKNGYYDPVDAADEFMVKWTSTKIEAVTWVGVSVALFLAPEPSGLTKILAVGAGCRALYLIGQLHGYIESDLDHLAFQGISMELESLKKAPKLNFEKPDEPVRLLVRGTFTNLIAEDEGKGIFPKFFKSLQDLNRELSSFVKAYSKVKSWFKSEPASISEGAFKLTGTRKSKVFTLNPERLSLGTVSDERLDLSIQKNGSSINIFANCDESGPIDFNFELIYDQAEIGEDLVFQQAANYEYRPSELTWFIGSGELITPTNSGAVNYGLNVPSCQPQAGSKFDIYVLMEEREDDATTQYVYTLIPDYHNEVVTTEFKYNSAVWSIYQIDGMYGRQSLGLGWMRLWNNTLIPYHDTAFGIYFSYGLPPGCRGMSNPPGGRFYGYIYQIESTFSQGTKSAPNDLPEMYRKRLLEALPQ